MAQLSEWLQLMLAEIARKQEERMQRSRGTARHAAQAAANAPAPSADATQQAAQSG